VGAGPALAAIVVTHDSGADLPATLAALRPQLCAGDELVIVDCGSAERPDVPGARVLHEANLGFAGGAAVGVRASSAELLFFLNPDAITAPGALDALRAVARSHPGWGAWQALVTLPGGQRVNTSGGETHWLGMGWSGRFESAVADVPDGPREVMFASGAALVVRRSAWHQSGGFEPRYFMYGEDLDLSLRLWLSGWGVGVVPEAVVEHGYEFTKGAYKWFHLERNRWWTVVAGYPAPLLALVAPGLLAFELAVLPLAAAGGWLGAKLRADLAVLRTLPWALRRRRAVQASARVSPRRFAERALSGSLDSPFLGPVARFPPLAAAQRAYWRLVLRLLPG
jgi:GT2 family glycosyltransferase